MGNMGSMGKGTQRTEGTKEMNFKFEIGNFKGEWERLKPFNFPDEAATPCCPESFRGESKVLMRGNRKADYEYD